MAIIVFTRVHHVNRQEQNGAVLILFIETDINAQNRGRRYKYTRPTT